MSKAIYNTPITVQLAGINALPVAYQFVRNYQADWLLFSPGVFIDTSPNPEISFNSAVQLDVYQGQQQQSEGWIPTSQQVGILSKTLIWTSQCNMPSYIPISQNVTLNLVFLFSTHGVYAPASGTLAFAIQPLTGVL